MAGSHAVIAHKEAGHGRWVASHPPAIPFSPSIGDDCPTVSRATGRSLLVIDRAGHSGAMACAFDQPGWGVLGMRADNAPAGLASLAAPEVGLLEEGTKSSSGPWPVPRPAAPRHFGMVEPAEGQTLGDWGTPKVKAAWETTEWPRVDRERRESQANGCKRLIAHGALHTNDGRKKILEPDRQQQRARAQLAPALAAAQKRGAQKAAAVQTPPEKVVESVSRGPGTRLAQRQRA
jgi:hypothetical protein